MKSVLLKTENGTGKDSKYSKNIQNTFDLTEIINGEEVVTPSPLSKHQSILLRLAVLVKKYIDENGLGSIFISPLDVILEEGVNRLQPDLIFIRKENLGIVQDWIRGVPDLVIEVASKGTITLDSIIKKEIYEKYGVAEFWLVLSEEKTMQVYTIENNRYKIFNFAEIEGTVKSQIIKGLEVSIKEVFCD